MPFTTIQPDWMIRFIRETSVATWAVDGDGYALDIPEWIALTGQTADEAKGDGWMDAIHRDDVERVSAAWRTAVIHQSHYNTDYRLRCADGIYRWFNARGYAILDAEGIVVKWIGVILPIAGTGRFSRPEQGDRLLLNGKMLTGRDAAHKRIKDMLDAGEPLPVEFKGRVIYYVGPVDPVGEEVVGPAGPTTATRMDKFTRMMLDQGLLAMVGKAERGPDATKAIAEGKSAYLMAVGGAAYLVARAIKGSKVVGFADLGMEAIYEFEVVDFPVTVAVDSTGANVHQLAPLVWKEKIAREGLLVGA